MLAAISYIDEGAMAFTSVFVIAAALFRRYDLFLFAVTGDTPSTSLEGILVLAGLSDLNKEAILEAKKPVCCFLATNSASGRTMLGTLGFPLGCATPALSAASITEYSIFSSMMDGDLFLFWIPADGANLSSTVWEIILGLLDMSRPLSWGATLNSGMSKFGHDALRLKPVNQINYQLAITKFSIHQNHILPDLFLHI